MKTAKECLPFSLLQEWCDALLNLQITEIKPLSGGILCPSCARVHGRCGDAVYPLLFLADRTGESKYLEGAKRLFDWWETMTRPDGSFLNDTNGSWQGITVFSSIALSEALHFHGHLLDACTRERWENRLRTAMKFLEHFMDGLHTNVNYPITYTAALAAAYQALGDSSYLQRAQVAAHQALSFFTPEGLIYGEGKPAEAVTPKGCRPIDLGYNVEESLGGLALYARITDDQEVLPLLKKSLLAHLEFMLPDGGWDNSWGTRSSKWTYWGSRTSDGCQIAYGLMASHHPLFGEAVLRNTRLLKACTHDGLLHGGPMYHSAGEPPCSHHTFCHAKALASLLDYGFEEPEHFHPLPREKAEGIRHIPSAGVYLAAAGSWRGTVSEYDFEYVKNGCATGGALTMLWHPKTGPLLAGTMTEYSLVEPNNMQIPQYYGEDICLTPRISYWEQDVVYRSIADKQAVVRQQGQSLTAEGTLVDEKGEGTFSYRIRYLFDAATDSVLFRVSTQAPDASYIFPVISKNSDRVTVDGKHARIFTDQAEILLESSADFSFRPGEPSRIFNPVGGWEAVPFLFHLVPGEELELCLSVRDRL